ncbi:MAG: arylsulfatase A-like enzyme, partial [Myxococcota bacterium]
MVPARRLADLEDLVIIALLSACWSTVPDTLPPGDPDRPDIIFVSIDTLRADHLSSYGHSRETSPFLDRLAAEGVRFSQARSASPWTLPAHTTMLTGQLPSTHRVVDDNLSLADSVPVLPALLQEAGYNTGGFVSTLYVSRKFGFERGFDAFNDFGINTERQ